MKNVFTALLLTLASSQAFATQADFKFVGLDNTDATSVCLNAAKVGYYQAKKIAKTAPNFNEVEFITTKCNGLSIRQFANKYVQSQLASNESDNQSPVSYQFKTVDNSEASKICAFAAKEGLRKAISVNGEDAKYITCNGLRIESFARKFKNS